MGECQDRKALEEKSQKMKKNKEKEELLKATKDFIKVLQEKKALIIPADDEELIERLAAKITDDFYKGSISAKDIYDSINRGKEDLLISVATSKPKNFITTGNKVSSAAFNGIIGKQEVQPGGNIKTLISINFDEAQSQGITTSKRLTAYDREIHDAITSLYIDGGNEYITTNMIYQTITGNTEAKKGMSAKTAEAIGESVTKLMYSRIVIDATEEAQALNKDISKLSKDSPLLPAERVTAILNGQIIQSIHILKAPPLYEYSEAKKQISKVDLKLLDSPVRKNAEVIKLQGYLMRRILSMKSSVKVSNTIIYDKIYKQVDMEVTTPGAIRNKKAKIRTQTKQILDYWKQKDFIKGYEENTQGQEVYSISISF